MIPTDPEERDVLAGEYVLGLLEPDAARAVEQAIASDPLFAQCVAFWEERLMPAAATLRPMEPDPELWRRIEAGLGGSARAIGELRMSAPAPSGGRSSGGDSSRWRRLWHDASVWRATTALATAAAIMLAILPLRPPQPEDATRFFAILQSRDASGAETGPGWLIQVMQDGTVRSLPLAEIRPGSGRSLQLWTLWDQARGPVSLGVLPPGGAIRLPPERLEVIGNDQLFEITLEPEAGSPTGRPTGRILFIGRAKASKPQTL